MKEYIEKDRLIAEGWKLERAVQAPGSITLESMEIRDVPAADVRPVVRGEWRHDGSRWVNRWLCSACGYLWVFSKDKANFCPHCGADMRPQEENRRRGIVSAGIYDIEEIHRGCTVQIWKNSTTGEVSVGWWKEGEEIG